MSTARPVPSATKTPGITKLTYPTGSVGYVARVKYRDATGKLRFPSREFQKSADTPKPYDAAKAWRTDLLAKVAAGGQPSTRTNVRTVELACAEYLAGRAVSANTLDSYTHALKPLRKEHGALPVQKLGKQHIGDLVARLTREGYPRADKQPSRPWGARSVNNFLKITGMVLDAELAQGYVFRNVADMIDKRPGDTRTAPTLTAEQVLHLFRGCADDRDLVAWRLALSGLRRGEIVGLRWADVDLDVGELRIVNTRVSVSGTTVEKGPKSKAGIRTLPIPLPMAAALRKARTRQATERMALGSAWTDSGYVVTDEAGVPFRPQVLSDHWERMLVRVELPAIHLHDARHTCGTLMGLEGVPAAVIAAWLGHADGAFTARVYVHSQPAAVAALALSPSLNLG